MSVVDGVGPGVASFWVVGTLLFPEELLSGAEG